MSREAGDRRKQRPGERYNSGQREKFCQLILISITEIVATRCQILRLKCTKFDFGWGSAPDPDAGAYSTLQTLSWI